MLKKIQTRGQAFFAHLFISLIIFLCLLGIIFIYWYPGVFIHFGGWQGVKIVAAVDLVLGPLLTLIVFNRKKKSLKWDLTIIATLQFICLSYGIWVVEQQRPIAQILLDDTLYVVPKSDFQDNAALKKLEAFQGSYPKFVVLDFPEDHTLLATTIVADQVMGNPLHLQYGKYLDARSSKTNDTIKSKLVWNFRNLTPPCNKVNVESSHASKTVCLGENKGASRFSD